ncbi:hypothetical protein [uncultured Sphingobium sp.]|uniref:hypothetical protein n=1 Tax=uncultured Sphingobium sp. TaxID=316087 RepID=UPI0032B2F2B5
MFLDERSIFSVQLCRLAAMVLGALAVGACSSGDSNGQLSPDDQALLRDREAHHEFQCNDGSLLHAAYRDEGLVMILSGPAQPQPVRLTAPAQGLTYVGESITATITNRVLRISETDRPERTCTSGKPLGLSPAEPADDFARGDNSADLK